MPGTARRRRSTPYPRMGMHRGAVLRFTQSSAQCAAQGHPLADAFLWVKTPGESDGTCNGGPRAGEWWADYALELSRAAEALGSTLPR